MLFTSKSSKLSPLQLLHHLTLLLTLHPLLTHASPTPNPTLSRRYTPGWCGVHITQYQKNEATVNPSPNYALDLTIFDASQAEIGSVSHADAPGGQGVGVTSELPYVLIVTTGNVDDDPVSFAYAGQNWNSGDGSRCRFGGYDSGSRQGDCGFSC